MLNIGDDIRETIQTDDDGMFTIELPDLSDNQLQNEFRIFSLNEEVIFEGMLEDFYIEDTNIKLLPPDIEVFDAAESNLSGYNHNGEVLVVKIDSETVLTYDIKAKNVFSVHIEHDLQDGDKLVFI